MLDNAATALIEKRRASFRIGGGSGWMSREIEIRDRIVRLDPAAFQSLSQELLTQRYGYDKPTHRGSATHSAATAPGTPDTIWSLPDGKFAFLECGHYPEKAEAKNKIEADIRKCLDAEKKELKPGQLVKIVIAYSCRRLTGSDLSYLRDIDGRVDLVGPDEMAMWLACRYPNLAREHLGVEASTGQIMSPGEFEAAVEKNSFASTLKVDLLGRDKEVGELLAALEDNQFVLVFGLPGYGKTRLCLEVLRRYAADKGARPFVIQSNKLPIWDDLVNDIPKSGASVILLDDANELSGLAGFADFVSSRDNIKVLMTVRNYAADFVKSSVAKFCKPHSYKVNPLDDDSASAVIEKGFGIARGRASADIVRLSRGNMRLACAAAEVAKERGSEVFATMPELIEACYGEKISGMDVVVKKAAAVVSVLGSHKIEENEDLEKVLQRVGVSHDSYVEACVALHREELVDACQNMVAVSPGEQVLRDYLLYKVFIAERSLSLSDIDMLQCGKSRCPAVVAILVNNFYSEEVISALKAQLDDIWASAGKDKCWEMVNEYHFLPGEKGLGFLFDAIEHCEPGNHDYLAYQFDKRPESYSSKSRILVSLNKFLHASGFGEPEELFFKALGKNILPPGEAKTVLTTTMCFDEASYSNDFQYENEVIKHLEDGFRATGEARYGILLAYYAQALLSPTYESAAMVEGNKVTYTHGDHVYTEAMIGLRKRAIVCLRKLRSHPELVRLCDSVITGLRGVSENGEAGRLWKATLEETYREYVSQIEVIDEYGIPGFAQLEKSRISQGVIDEDGLPALGLTTEKRIAACIFDSSFGDDALPKLAEIVGSASSRELVGAISLVCSVGRQCKGCIPYWDLKVIVDLGIDALSEFAEELILSGLSSSAIPNELFIRWFDSFGAERIRGLVLEHQEAETPEWLSRIDEARFKKFGASSELARDIEEGADVYGETISYEVAMAIDCAVPGFFVRYASNILQKAERGSQVLKKLFPYDISKADQRAFASKPEILGLVEEAMLGLANGKNLYWNKDLLGFVITSDDEFLEKAALASVTCDATYAMGCLGEVAWKEGNGEDATDRVWKVITEQTMAGSLFPKEPRLLKHFLDYATGHCGDAVVSWLASHSIRDGKLVDYLPDVAMELSSDLKAKYMVQLCKAGLSSEELKKVPVYISSFGASWSGSEIPLIQGKVDFVNKAIENLPGIAFIKHREVLESKVASLKKRMKDVEVEEFLWPF